MTEIDKKREEIRKWLEELLAIARSEGELTKYKDGVLDAKEILDYLHSQSVVIKVDRELPIITAIGEGFSAKKEQVKMLNDNFAAVESLIDE